MLRLAFIAVVLLLSTLAPATGSAQIKRPEEPPPPTRLSKNVWARIEANDVPGALKLMDRAIATNEDLFDAYQLRATIRLRFTDNVDGALEDLRRALAIKPGDSEIHRRYANTLIRYKNDYEGAIREYDEVLKNDPRSGRFLAARAVSNKIIKRYGPALDDINKLLVLEPDNVDAHMVKSEILSAQTSITSGTDYLSNFLKTYSDQRAGKLPKLRGEKVIKKGLKKIGEGPAAVPVNRYSRMEMSIVSNADWDKQTRDQTTARLLARAHVLLGRNYTKLNQLDEALAALAQALDFDPNTEEAMGIRGLIYLTRNEPLRAIKEFDAALDIADEGYFYLNRGVAYLLVNEDKKAQKDFDFLMKTWPESRSVMEARMEEAKKQRSLTTK